MSISTEITRIIKSKTAIKNAIKEKGVEVLDSDKIDTYANKISSISGDSITINEYNPEIDEWGWSDFCGIYHNIETLPDDISFKTFEGAFYNMSSLKKLPKINMSKIDIMRNSFYYCKSIESIKGIDTSEVENFESAFVGCEKLKEIEIDTSNGKKMGSAFARCKALTSMSNINLLKATAISAIFANCSSILEASIDAPLATEASNIFYGCTNLKKITKFNIPLAERSSSCFENCSNLEEINNITFGNINSLYSMFKNCSSLEEIPEINCSNVNGLDHFVDGCSNLTNLGPLTNLGQAYGTGYNTAHNVSKKLDLSTCPLLTHDSLVAIFNGLYDLNLATTFYTQDIVLGSTNYAKLTAEEIEIATNKGWTVLEG